MSYPEEDLWSADTAPLSGAQLVNGKSRKIRYLVGTDDVAKVWLTPGGQLRIKNLNAAELEGVKDPLLKALLLRLAEFGDVS